MTVHLHWLYHRGPLATAGVTRALALCGRGGLPVVEVTTDPARATCARCIELHGHPTGGSSSGIRGDNGLG